MLFLFWSSTESVTRLGTCPRDSCIFDLIVIYIDSDQVRSNYRSVDVNSCQIESAKKNNTVLQDDKLINNSKSST